jgi:outer membrane protein assembly factor BamD (BamD/ComL family)
MMKKIAVVLAVAFAMSLTACSSEKQEQEQSSGQMPMHEEGHDDMDEEHMQQAGVMYQCPMKCEEDKMYDEEGDCPVCGMPLERVDTEDIEDVEEIED